VQLIGGCEFGRASSQMGWSPTCDFVGLRRSSREGRKEGDGGVQGGFYRWPWHGEGVRVRARLHRAAGRHLAGEGRRLEEEGGPDRWGPPDSGRRRWGGYPFG
jgi:hypothetical protein